MSTTEFKHFNIFYSWQSDIDPRANHYFIRDCLKTAISQLKKDDEISVIPRLDSDTKGASGSPNIAETILRKIDSCQLLIADITLINQNWKVKLIGSRFVPNPNVLFELGYATSRLTWNRIICINNDKFSDIGSLPFDILQNRISRYSYDGHSDTDKAQEHLTSLLKTAIKGIIDKYDALLTAEQQGNVTAHDLRIFRSLDVIADDVKFLELLNQIANNQIVTREEYNLIDNVRNFLKAERNQFLYTTIKSSATQLLEALDDARMTLATNLFADIHKYVDEESGQEIFEHTYHLPKAHEWYGTNAEFEEDQYRRITLIHRSIDIAIASYQEFRGSIKQYLFI